jgi:hypothetical protein
MLPVLKICFEKGTFSGIRKISSSIQSARVVAIAAR